MVQFLPSSGIIIPELINNENDKKETLGDTGLLCN